VGNFCSLSTSASAGQIVGAMPRTLKRRVEAISRDASPQRSESPEPARQRQRSSSTSASVEESSAAEDDDGYSGAAAQTANLVKKLVRLALATEYSRAPLRRGEISAKVFKETNASRSFKAVFAEAQRVLQGTFGMQLVELPSKEKTTLKDRRIQATQPKTGGSSNKSWILVSVLPKEYKTNPAIIQPSRAPSVEAEAGYTAMYSFILALIYLNNNSLPEQKLERYLRRVNAETYTPFGSLEKLLQRMSRDGYVEKRRDTSSGEEIVEWVVGPRGKVEVGVNGVIGLVKSVYGYGVAGAEDGVVKEEEEELNRKLSRSLGINISEQQPADQASEDESGGNQVNAEPHEQRQRRRGIDKSDER